MKIRLATVNDAQQIVNIYAPYVENTTISFESIVPDAEEMKIRIRCITQDYPWIVLEEGNKILGYAYASKYHERAAYRWSVDVSIYVDENNHSRGIGKALYTSLLMILKYQGFYNAYAIICSSNEKSIGIHEYFGFKKIAQLSKVGYKLESWLDVGWWELLLQQHESEPEEPLSISAIGQTRLLEAFECGIKIMRRV